MIRVVLADDHKMFAKGIANLLEKEEDIQVMGVFTNGKELVEFLKKEQVDLVLTDMNMPGMDGLAVIQQINKEKIKARLIVLSMYDDEDIFKKCQKQGVDGYVLKDADPDELIYTIREVINGHHVMHFQRVLKQVDEDQYYDAFKQKFKLSRRELQILSLIKDGHTNQSIADELFLSIYTVETHRKNIHHKLGVNTVVELMKKALEMNL
ncbi:response regulator transcription factor [Echinicola vietnamensis]|uniref:Response regulator containing a CheY-like receiver domain and an HTH DNA-binding domain n=1 Tax=Echinicola vietnamensis (strain DSM 17526 / LMG 23754 / KMM 6221) TaxID=926556 RepID=L0FWH1_ECHVK|nr:response regulator transcription factor [Echinicola vietnamensis]AGA77393.1 response regulator containing a CheY-like receiver domain and an HTH DNA-binding domain [Echinicola vietnamensis DSM 17526]